MRANHFPQFMKFGRINCLNKQHFCSSPLGFTLFPIEQYDLGQRLDRYLKATAIGWISAQKHLRNGNIKVLKADGATIAQNSHRFEQGDKLLLKAGLGLQQLLIGDKNPKHIEMDFNEAKKTLDQMLLFDNQNITVVNKPPGFSVQGGPDPYHNLFSLMAARFRKQMVYISHRLDKPTSGLVVLPKNIKTAQLLGKAFEAREGIQKYYIAMTEGSEVIQKQGCISCHLQWTNKHRAKISEQIGGNDRSQLSQTMFIRLKAAKLSDIFWRNLIGVKLITGRKHQIRCQLSQYLLNPIVNDLLYRGRVDKTAGEAIYLHSFGLKIKSKELIKDVFKLNGVGDRIISQNSLGLIKQDQDSLLLTSVPPAFWSHHLSPWTQNQLTDIMRALDRVQKESTPSKHVSQIK